MVLKDSSKIMLGSQEVQRIYLGSVKVYENFPAGYRPVEWLQASGTQYINTGVQFSGHYKYEVNCEFANENYNQLFGLLHWYGHCVFVLNGVIYADCIGEREVNTNISYNTRVLCTVDLDSKTVTVNDFIHSANSFEPSSSVAPCLLFACWNTYNSSIANYGKGRIYGFKWWNENILIRDMRPCVRISDGVAGMYDLVNNVFYTNAGTGNFVVPS